MQSAVVAQLVRYIGRGPLPAGAAYGERSEIASDTGNWLQSERGGWRRISLQFEVLPGGNSKSYA